MRTHRSDPKSLLRRRATLATLAALAFVVLVAPGCAARAVPVEGAPPAVDEDAFHGQSINDVVATLIVENSRMVDYRIYLTRQGGERLGIVHGPGKAKFLLRGAQLPHTGELRVVAVPIAARQVLSSSAYVPRGHTARFIILPEDAFVTVDPLPAPPDTTRDSTTAPDPARKPTR